MTLIACSAFSCLALFLGRDYFNCCEEEDAEEQAAVDANMAAPAARNLESMLDDSKSSALSLKSAPDSAIGIQGLKKGKALSFGETSSHQRSSASNAATKLDQSGHFS